MYHTRKHTKTLDICINLIDLIIVQCKKVKIMAEQITFQCKIFDLNTNCKNVFDKLL